MPGNPARLISTANQLRPTSVLPTVDSRLAYSEQHIRHPVESPDSWTEEFDIEDQNDPDAYWSSEAEAPTEDIISPEANEAIDDRTMIDRTMPTERKTATDTATKATTIDAAVMVTGTITVALALADGDGGSRNVPPSATFLPLPIQTMLKSDTILRDGLMTRRVQ
ncbi:Uu.00g066930.m01.CDS01 [Anthostomella pinea]|uniref:Uu.00g066930.m01.CDS01 n=1 Tax=Anthostomella pinea TaxID=933095 RepID=A0AAI8VV87_9PEZI|nr:Uu.00g066930.m01.CDS01 [Anthostomella pinea]